MTPRTPQSNDRTTLTEAHQKLEWDQAVRMAAHLAKRIHRAAPDSVALTVTSGLELVTALLTARDLQTATVIAGPGMSDDALAALGVHAVTCAAAPAPPLRWLQRQTIRLPEMREPGVWLLSSGTTGGPQPAFWPWRRLAPGRWGAGAERWGIGYAPHSFAAVTATCQALGRAASIEFVRPVHLALPTEGAVMLTVATATPSFWRMAAIAAQDPTKFRQVETVTIGGEPIEASLLRLVREIVAPKRIKQIFATTEHGTVIQVDDGLPGLPLDMSARRLPGGTAFDVRDDRLRVSVAPGAPFVDTGDLVEVAEGRIHIVGRTGIAVNVGGLKANPYRVARVLQCHQAVLAARAYGVRSPVLGQVVAADVVLRCPADPRQMATELKLFSSSRLEAHERPRRIRIVDDLVVAASGKVQL